MQASNNNKRSIDLLQTLTSSFAVVLNRVDATLDLRDAFLMLQDQHRYRDRSADDDRHNRHQQSTQGHDRINQPHSRLRKPTTVGQRPTTVFLVELTGIEPVASWLQTRRSPS